MMALTSQEASFHQAFKKMTDGDREVTVLFAWNCARENPRNAASHLTLVVSANRGVK